MSNKRPYVLSIAGFDPSGGAGVLADVKTFESSKVYGLGIISSNTFQNESEFTGVDWICVERMISQLELLVKKYKIEFVKIGLIESLAALEKLIEALHHLIPDCKIIWDPILKASVGFNFHNEIGRDSLNRVLKKIFVVTPNLPEAQMISANADAFAGVKEISVNCNVYLKGGHAEGKDAGRDYLYTMDGKQFSYRPRLTAVHSKHGSGCVLSSSLTANLARGFKLLAAGLRAKQYTENYLSSTKSLLGYHKL